MDEAGDIEVTEGLALGSWRNISINVWRERASVDLLRRLKPFTRKLKARWPSGTATLTVLDGKLPPRLTPEERAEAASMAAEFDGTTLAVAHVLESGGFRGAATRMVLSGVLTLSRPKYAHAAFGDLAEAADWIVDKAVPPAERAGAAEALVRRVDELRRRLG